MKSIFFFITLLFITLLSLGQSCPSNYLTTVSPPNLRQWDPVYSYSILSDEFDAASLNTLIWGVRTGCERNTDEEAQHYKNSPNNISISNGTLKLIARKETTWDWINPPPGATGNPTWGTRDYTSGEIYSLNNSFNNGEYTIRCRFPVGSGSWAAFWIFGAPSGVANEIDFFEQDKRENNNGTKIDNVFHWYYAPTGTCGPWLKNWPNNVNDWHIYRCRWTPYEVKFFIDDMNVPVRKWSRYETSGSLQYVGIGDIKTGTNYVCNANYPIYSGGIIANYALKSGIIDDSVLPQPFEIDYIKVRKFFLAPEITFSNNVICSSGTATMDVASDATNITWSLSPAYLFSGATTGTGKVANIFASSSYQGKGKITFSFNISSDISNPKETYTAEKEIWIKGPDASETSFDVYRSDGVKATQYGNNFSLCSNTTYHIYVMNSGPVPLSNYTWTVPSGWTKNYTWQNMISVNPNSSSGGPITVSATNTACNTVVPVLTGYTNINYSCGSYYMALSPNPSTSETTVILSADGDKVVDENTSWEAQVYDQQFGLKEKKTKLKGKDAKLNTSGWKDGVYIVNVIVDGQKISEKLVVKH